MHIVWAWIQYIVEPWPVWLAHEVLYIIAEAPWEGIMYKMRLIIIAGVVLATVLPAGCRVENGADNDIENGFIQPQFETRMNIGPIAIPMEAVQTLSIADFAGTVEVVGIARQEAVMFARVVAQAHSPDRADDLAAETFVDLVATDYGGHIEVEPVTPAPAEQLAIAITITVPSRTNIETWGRQTLVELENISGSMRFVPEPPREPEAGPRFRPQAAY